MMMIGQCEDSVCPLEDFAWDMSHHRGAKLLTRLRVVDDDDDDDDDSDNDDGGDDDVRCNISGLLQNGKLFRSCFDANLTQVGFTDRPSSCCYK